MDTLALRACSGLNEAKGVLLLAMKGYTKERHNDSPPEYESSFGSIQVLSSIALESLSIYTCEDSSRGFD